MHILTWCCDCSAAFPKVTKLISEPNFKGVKFAKVCLRCSFKRRDAWLSFRVVPDSLSCLAFLAVFD